MFVERLREVQSLSGESIFEYQNMVDIGKQMNLQVGDFRIFVDKLNANGILLKKNARTFQLL